MKKIFDILLFILLCVTPIFFVILLATQWSDLQSPQRVLLIDFVILDVAVLVNVIHKYFWSRSMNKLFKEFRNPGRRNNTMFKRKNKNANKTGIHTPKFRNPTPPPPLKPPKQKENKTMYGLKLYIPFEDLDAYIHNHISKDYKNHTFVPIKTEVDDVGLGIEITLMSANPIESDGVRYKLDLDALSKEANKCSEQ